MSKYILLLWPESQDYIGEEGCYSCSEIDGAVFVPEDFCEDDDEDIDD